LDVHGGHGGEGQKPKKVKTIKEGHGHPIWELREVREQNLNINW